LPGDPIMSLRAFLAAAPVVLFLSSAPTAARAASDGTVLETRPYVLARWDSLQRPERSVTRADYESARADRDLLLSRVRYASHGLEVTAIVAAPRAKSKRPAPVVLFGRGGYTVGDVGWQYVALFHHLVRAGF